MKTKITILDYNLSNNSVGRAYILADVLSKNYDVQILGPLLKGKTIWEPLQKSSIPIKIIPFYNLPRLIFNFKHILNLIDGDVIYAVKPRMSSFGIGIALKWLRNKPLILDIDDWELGFYLRRGKLSRLISFLKIYDTNGYLWTMILHLLIKKADRVTAISKYLLSRYGGELVPHVKDTDILNPENDFPVPSELVELENKKNIMFLGTPSKAKGLDDLVEAINKIEDDNIVLIIIGVEKNKYASRLKKASKGNTVFIGKIDLNRLPHYLKQADVIVVPQRKNLATVGQMPSKIYDAMAMGKPIISTNVSDIPETISECGYIVEPESPDAIREAILELLDNPRELKRMGDLTREKSVKEYSYHKYRNVLNNIINDVMQY
jgi:glycosyltransferase involved in cell wall biosynthesis